MQPVGFHCATIEVSGLRFKVGALKKSPVQKCTGGFFLVEN
jgi:hypothetical protein